MPTIENDNYLSSLYIILDAYILFILIKNNTCVIFFFFFMYVRSVHVGPYRRDDEYLIRTFGKRKIHKFSKKIILANYSFLL